MGKKIFLPVSTQEPHVELPFMSENVAARGLPKATKAKPWVMKMFSTLTFLGLIFGGTIAGFSFKIINDDQVGYYNSEPGYMGPGIYFQFPWTTEKMNVVNMGGFLSFNNLVGVVENQEFKIQNIDVVYNVSDVNKYIQTLKKVRSPIYCQNEIKDAILDLSMQVFRTERPSLIENIEGQYDNSRLIIRKKSFNSFLLKDIPMSECGIIIDQAVFSTPIIARLMHDGWQNTVNIDQEDDYPEEEGSTLESMDQYSVKILV